MKRVWFAMYIGFYAGLIWGVFAYVFYYLEFTTIKPAFLIQPFVTKDFLHSWMGVLSGLLLFILYSIIAAFIYSGFLYKSSGPWPGILFGIVWWIVIFGMVGPYFDLLPPLRKLNLDTRVTELCRYTLWGAFIGYSITLEFTDEREREPAPLK
jgi:hypothetical protein